MHIQMTLAATVFFGMASGAHAADFSFTGDFDQDDDVQLFDFSVGATSNVTLRTYSYAGGTQADGNVVSDGGFDPILALFDSSGSLVGQNDDGVGVPADPVTDAFFDTLLEESLDPGAYTVSVMQFDNFAAGSSLDDGFTREGEGNFTPELTGCDAAAFCDVAGGIRTDDWAFDVLNVDEAEVVEPTPEMTPIPLPASLPVFALGLAGFAAASRRKR